MPQELPYETFQRITGKQWTPEGRDTAYKQYGITAPAGSSEANLALQKAMIGSPIVTADKLSTSVLPTIPTQPKDATNYSAISAGVIAGIPTQPKTQAQEDLEAGKTESKTLMDRIKALYGDISGKASYQEKLIEEKGISQQERDIQSLTNQLRTIGAESQAQQLSAEESLAPMSFITGQQAQIQRASAVQSLIVSSQLQAKQGNLSLALSQIDRAVNLKYQPLEQELEGKTKQLELLDRYVLTPAETARKNELQAQYNAQEEQLKDQKAKDLIFEKALVDAMQGQMPNSEVVRARELYSAGQVDAANMLIAPYSGAAQKMDISRERLALAQEKATKTGTGVEGVEEEPMTMWEISEFTRRYGWTPPYGFTESQLLQFTRDNPTATPAQLEAGAKQVLAQHQGGTTPKTKTFLDENYFRTSFTKDELKAMSDKLGTSKWYTTATADINRFIEEAMKRIEESRAQGYSDTEILKFLTS